MKFLIILGFLALASLATAYPQQQRRNKRQGHFRSPYADIVNLRSHNENYGDGSYNYLYENSDGQTAEERGYQKPNPGNPEQPIQTAEGSYQYYSPEGILIRVTYTADENGFRPYGDHLPTPPPIPPEIQRSLDLIYAGIERRKQEEAAAATRGFPSRRF